MSDNCTIQFWGRRLSQRFRSIREIESMGGRARCVYTKFDLHFFAYKYNRTQTTYSSSNSLSLISILSGNFRNYGLTVRTLSFDISYI